MCRITNIVIYFTFIGLPISHANAPDKTNSQLIQHINTIEKESSLENNREHLKSIETLLIQLMRADQVGLKNISSKDFSSTNPIVGQALDSSERYFIFKPVLDYHLRLPKGEKGDKAGCESIENELVYNYSLGRDEGEPVSGNTELALKAHKKICSQLK